MKKELTLLRNGIMFGFGVFLVIGILGIVSYFVVKAWNTTDPNDLQSTPGDKLTSLKFNGLFARTKANYVKSMVTNGDSVFNTSTLTDAGISINLTISANPVQISIHSRIVNGGAADTLTCVAVIDGVDQSLKGGTFTQALTAGRSDTMHIDYISDPLTAGSHTFGLKCRSGGSSFTLNKSAGNPLYYSVVEIRQ